MLDGEVAKRVTCVEQVSDRILAVKISAMPVDMLIVQIYMLTTDHEDKKVEEMYDKIEKIMDKEKGCSNVIIMGYFSAMVGEGNYENGNKVIGKYGLGKRNDRGQMLVDFCVKRQLLATNTWFQQEKRKRYT